MLEVDAEVDRRSFTVAARFEVAAGERLALFGPSGAGKTTLLEVIAGLVRPHRARVALAGRVLTSTERPVVALPPWQRGVGLLRQDPGLFPHLSVRDNLGYSRVGSAKHPPARQAGDLGAEMAELAAALGVDGLLGSMPAKLSGGQAHRVALGRLLLSRCDALLLDEPYTGLDASMRRTLTELVISVVEERRVPAMLVAHELAEAQAFAHRLAVLDHGRLLQVGAPDEVVLRPASRRVAELVGYTAFVPVPGSAGPTGTLAGVHPDRVVQGRPGLTDGDLALIGVVTACRPAGALWEISLRTGDTTVTGRLPDPAPAGAELAITITDPPLFGPDGAAVDVPNREQARS